MSKPVVLLTATIECGGTPLVERQKASVRESDYLWAIKGWVQTEEYDTLIFCENSGAPLQRIEECAISFNKFQHKLIFLSCDKNAGARKKGKGYGEMEIIRHAIDSVPDLEPGQLIVKVTGRLRAYNASQLLRELAGSGMDIACLLRRNLSEADSRLFGITVKCAREQLLPRQETIDDLEGRFFENALADAVHATILSGGRWSLLPCEPFLHGFSGSSGIRFGFSPFERAKKMLRHQLAKRLY
jgi:hypothetical protein